MNVESTQPAGERRGATATLGTDAGARAKEEIATADVNPLEEAGEASREEERTANLLAFLIRHLTH